MGERENGRERRVRGSAVGAMPPQEHLFLRRGVLRCPRMWNNLPVSVTLHG